MAYVPPHKRNQAGGASGGRGSGSLSSLLRGQRGGDHGRGASDRGMRGGRGKPTPAPQYGIESRPLLLKANDFQAFHASLSGVTKYFVHSPNCSCTKLPKPRRRPLVGDVFVRHDPFDNLIVVPTDRSGVPAIFICHGTDEYSYRQDSFACEKKLAELIEGAEGLTQEVKLSQCLLAHQPNGFLAIVSRSLEEVQATIDRARNASYYTMQAGELPKDHYHFAVAVQLSTLQTLVSGTREDRRQAKVEILTMLGDSDYGAELSRDMINAYYSSALASAFPCGLELSDWHEMKQSPSDVSFNVGHHLKSLLNHTQGQPSRLESFVMVVGYIDGRAQFQLDILGGKRNLCESTIECAIREAKEEYSLQLDEEWVAARVPEKYGGSLGGPEKESAIEVFSPEGEEGVNAFFVMPPPPLL